MLLNKNEILSNRVDALFTLLSTQHAGGKGMSSASIGSERELFVDSLLKNVFPPHYRFSTGDITNPTVALSGQVDIVLEYPRGFSFPLLEGGPRLYLAEDVAAVIEVKSNLTGQWNEVKSTAEKLAEVQRNNMSQMYDHVADRIEAGTMGVGESETPEEQAQKFRNMATQTQQFGEQSIPIYAVGFEGWKTLDTVKAKIDEGIVDGIFVINEKIYASSDGTATSGLSSMLAFLEDIQTQFEKEKKVKTFPQMLSYNIK